ncbi:uncharacterized protein LOC131432884 [Malaya genurostris]|uniref:uncharacterized protein LOC131432884 n=1 Tax=Malaya genurostris TaxID=325434 RepID=UPI0026F3C42B|nr:uncharacterized protein LOC131432884 [Malaya genurostris]
MRSAAGLFLIIFIMECFSVLLAKSDTFSTGSSFDDATESSNRTLSRRKRFLLFPINGQLVITMAAAKLLIFKGPGGHYLTSEIDMYYPLPDYRYRIASLRLGQIAQLPNEPGPPKKTPPTPAPVMVSQPIPIPMMEEHHHHHHHDHDGHELTETELQQYLKEHPESWVPPGYGKERSDQLYPPANAESRNSYANTNDYDELSWNKYLDQDQDHTQAINLWHQDPAEYVERYFPRKKRSLGGGFDYQLDEEPDRFGINHHRDWEHFYHYRERRELYNTLEKEIGDRFNVPVKACILRSICEVRGFMLAPGKSMMMDIARIVFRLPLKEEMDDEYSAEMRNEEVDCHRLYGDKCPFSIVQLLLFGQLVW